MRRIILVVVALTLSSFVGLVEAKPRSSGNFSTTQRYFHSNGRVASREVKYSDKSYFYDSKGKLQGTKVNSKKK